MGSAISSEALVDCDCCGQLRLCRMYILQTGNAAWVCVECRTGKAK